VIVDPGPWTLDVLVIGAGPAGCAAARLLAQCGHQVLMIDRPAGDRHALAESIPPSAQRVLSALGMRNAVDAAGFEPWLGNTVWWGLSAARVEAFAPGEAGYQVERGRFDALLRTLAAEAGVHIRSGRVHDVDPGVSATIDSAGQTHIVTARFMLDCSGRAGVIARKGLRVADTSHRTVALAGIWRAAQPWPDEQRGHTLVASHADGWAWSVPTAPDTRYVTVMVDPERSHLTRGASSVEVYRAELAKVTPFTPFLNSAEPVDGPWGADASLYGTRRHAGPGFLLVGDAASFIDPLSSFGVKKALASGWLAAITANTVLTTPGMTEEAMSFFEQREQAVVASFRQQAVQFAADAVDGGNHPFWQARFAKPEDLDDGPDPAALACDPAVLAALDDLRRRPGINLRQSDQVRTDLRPAIRGNVIVRQEHLFVPAWPVGIRYLRNIDLLTLVRLAPDYRDVGDLYEAVLRASPGVSLPDFLGTLATLIARGALRHEV